MRVTNGYLKGACWLFTGALLGAGTALLLAPQSGKRTRRELVRFGRMARSETKKMQLQLRRGMDDLVEGAARKVQTGLNQGKDWTDQTARDIQNAFASGKKFLERELDKVMPARG